MGESEINGQEKEKGMVAQKVQFAQLPGPDKGLQLKPDLGLYYGIPLTVSGELGTASIKVRDLLALQEGSVIKLNKMAGESAAILVNNQYLGQAEVVVVNDRFGLRVSSIGKSDPGKKATGE